MKNSADNLELAEEYCDTASRTSGRDAPREKAAYFLGAIAWALIAIAKRLDHGGNR